MCQALLWRQYLLKRRSLASTIVELLSPIVLISLLVRSMLANMHLYLYGRCLLYTQHMELHLMAPLLAKVSHLTIQGWHR